MVDVVFPPVRRVRVGLVRAHGFEITIVRSGTGLVLEAAMIDRPDEVFTADAQTDDAALAAARAKDLAAGLAAELGVTTNGEPTVVWPTRKQLEDEVRRRGHDVPGLLSRGKAFMGMCGVGMDDRVGDVLGSRLPEYREQFRTELQRQGKAPSTIDPYVSKINKLSEIAAAITVVEGNNLTMAEVLRVAMRHKGVKRSAVARDLGISVNTLNDWLDRVSLPSSELFRSLLPKLEAILSLPPGTLTNLVGTLRPQGPCRTRKAALPFAQRLLTTIHESGLPVAEIGRRAGILEGTLDYWTRGINCPNERARAELVPKLEALLALEPGTLLDLLPPPRSADWYRWTLNARQEEEWEAFRRYKTDPPPSVRRMKANRIWRVYEDGTCPSADGMYRELRYFFGALALPSDSSNERMRGLGTDGNNLSIVDLANPRFLEAFQSLRKTRSGRSTWAHVSFLSRVRSMVRPETGYLFRGMGPWQNYPADALLLRKGEQPDGSFAQWKRHCRRLQKWITEWIEDLEDELPTCRDYSHIKAILELDRPMDALILLLQRMECDYVERKDYLSPESRAMLARDLLMVNLLVRNPLRRKHWLALSLGFAGKAQLRKTPKGGYEMFIPREQFKSLAHFRDEDYVAEVDPALTPLIDEYLEVHRPHLVGAEVCNLVFRPTWRKSEGREDGEVRNGIWLDQISVRYIPEFAPRGFGFHAVRHILATHLVRNYPDGIKRAADALHNTEKMIWDVYGHIRGRDLTRKAHNIIRSEMEISRDSLENA